MSSYRDMAEKAMNAGKAKQVTARQVKLKIGDEIVGLYRGRTFHKSKQRKLPDFYVYHFDTDDGPADVLFSNAFDGNAGASLREGKVYWIKLNEQRDIGRGRRFNDYSVMLVNPDADDEEYGEIEESPDAT